MMYPGMKEVRIVFLFFSGRQPWPLGKFALSPVRPGFGGIGKNEPDWRWKHPRLFPAGLVKSGA